MIRNNYFTGTFAGLLLMLTGAPSDGAPIHSSDRTTATVLAEFEIARDGDLPIVPVELNGRIYPCIVDTGASRTVWDLSLRDQLGKSDGKQPGYTGARIADFETFLAPEMRVGTLRIAAGAKVSAYDLGTIRKASGVEVSGCIGMDFLSQYIVQFDFDGGKLRFLSAVPTDPGDVVQLDPGPTSPGIVCRPFGIELGLLFDTGFTGTISVDQLEFQRAIRAGTVTELGVARGLTMGGSVESRFGLARGLQIGRVLLKDAIVEAGAPESDNLVGTRFLSRFVVTFDFPGRRAYFKKSLKTHPVDGWDRSGLGTSRQDGGFAVDCLGPFSPAIDAGFQLDDLIIEIDGVPARHFTTFQVVRLLEQDGRRVEMGVLRDGKRIMVRLFLREFRRARSVGETTAQ